MTRVIVQAYLEKLGHTVVGCAADGPEGVDLVRSLQPEVVLLDVHLPTTNGFDVLRKLKELTFSSIVIMLSGSDDSEFMRTAVSLGAASYITKPFTLEGIASALDAGLGASSLSADETPSDIS